MSDWHCPQRAGSSYINHLPIGQSVEGIFSAEAPSSQMTRACVKLKKKTNQHNWVWGTNEMEDVCSRSGDRQRRTAEGFFRLLCC